MRGSCAPVSMAMTRRGAVRCAHDDSARMVGADSTDDGSVATQRMALQRGQRGIGCCRIDRDHHLPLVGGIQRFQTQELTGSPHGVGDGDPILFQLDADSRCGPFVDQGGETAARRIAHAVHPTGNRVQQIGDQPVERCAVTGERRSETELLPLQHDGHAVIPDRSVDQDDIIRPQLLRPQSQSGRHHADACRVDENAIGGAALDHFRIPGDNPNPGRPRGLRHGDHDAFE